MPRFYMSNRVQNENLIAKFMETKVKLNKKFIGIALPGIK
jgi:hypothetical protein